MQKNKWKYRINGRLHETIVAINHKNKRVWTKFEPAEGKTPARVANILDIPSNVNWKTKTSHFETYDPLTKKKYDYVGVGEAGSFCSTNNTMNLKKDPKSEAVFFLLNPAGTSPATSLDIGSDTKGNITIQIDNPTWIGYAISKGKLKIL